MKNLPIPNGINTISKILFHDTPPKISSHTVGGIKNVNSWTGNNSQTIKVSPNSAAIPFQEFKS